MSDFQKGQKIKTKSGNELEIIQKLGAGGQGTVYKVNYLGKERALKWYFKNKLGNGLDFYNNISNNIKLGAPTEHFLWPIEITEFYERSFGYIMELRPSEYKEFSMFLIAKEKFETVEARINTALYIINSFRVLHGKGFSYQDLNDGNFFINPKNGDVLICDNDNVAPFGENLGIAGKCRYMAPEIVTSKKQPDIHTDRFSLAVVLYMLLFMNHPLEGFKTLCPCLTEELEYKFYGSEPLFVWDLENTSNRPVREIHGNEIKLWAAYPQFIREIFLEAFSQKALIGEDTEHRIQEKVWQETFLRLRDINIECSCGGETFVYVNEEVNKCVNCGCDLSSYLVMKVKKTYVILAPKEQLYSCHTLTDSEDFKTVQGDVVASLNDRMVVGLKNLSQNTWVAHLTNGTLREFSNGQTVKLERGMKIDFGRGNIAEVI